MRTLYNILITVVTGLKGPARWGRAHGRRFWRVVLRQRYGYYDAKLKQALTNRDAIWIHAETAAEIDLCTQIIRVLEPRMPNVKLVASARTPAGFLELGRRLPSQISKILLPFDRRSCVTRALAVIRPMVIILAEPRLAPNFLWRAEEMERPVILVNARFSPARRARYRRFGWFFRPIFASLTCVCAGDEREPAQLRALGCRSGSLLVGGEIPAGPVTIPERRVLDVPGLLDRIGAGADAPLLVAGGTCEGEEEMLVDVYLRLRARFPGLFLVLAPRDFDRCREIGSLLREREVPFAYRNEITAASRLRPGSLQCLLLNAQAELRLFWDRAALIVAGSTLAGDGGVDPLEPGMAARPLVFGPRTGPHAALTRRLIETGGALAVDNPAGLEQAVASLLEDAARRDQIGRETIRVVRETLAPIDQIVETVVEKLAGREVFLTPVLRR